jgi:two-component system phosphate regulon response regulator PhoB
MSVLQSELSAVFQRSNGRVLIVDDDEQVRAMVARFLVREGYQATEAATGAEALTAVVEGAPDIVLLDLMLSSEDGFEILTNLRRRSDVPVIVLSGRDGETDRVLGLKLGADDYVCKPFSPAELEARIESVLRRRHRSADDGDHVLRFGDLRIDLTAREVVVGDRVIETTAKEFDLLAFLASSPRQVFTREQLLAHVWDSSSQWQDDGTVTEHVRRVRRKIEPIPDQPRWVKTVRGVGYRFEP